MSGRISCRLLLWILPPLIFRCAALRDIFTPGELFVGAEIILPFFIWIAVVSSCRKNEFLFYPAVVFLSLLQLWPLYLLSPPWIAVALFAAMLVMSVFLRGRVWIILHFVFLWLTGASLIGVLWICQLFGGFGGNPENPVYGLTMGFIVFALIAAIFVRITVQDMIDHRRETMPERKTDYQH